MNPIPIDVVVEDELSEAVARKLLESSSQSYALRIVYSQGGYGYIKKNICGFNNAAKGTPYLVVTDLDTEDCAPRLIDKWFNKRTVQPNLLFRVAVKEVEAWLLAHRSAFAEFVGVREGLVPQNVEQIDDPKKKLIDIVRRSRRKRIREDIVPPQRSTREQGPDYNGRLVRFVESHWDPRLCTSVCRSLEKAIHRIDSFVPSWISPDEDGKI
ncbi:MAG: hypothetical protein IH987_15930 [Planctomycetes bacterium]|nr:hypothetical protein [Planctomycetota bacterium]